MAGVIVALLALFYIVIGVILNGITLSVLWHWFVAPKFGLPELTISQAIGLGIIVNFLTDHGQTSSDKDEKWWVPMLMGVAKPLFFLLIGWIVMLCM